MDIDYPIDQMVLENQMAEMLKIELESRCRRLCVDRFFSRLKVYYSSNRKPKHLHRRHLGNVFVYARLGYVHVNGSHVAHRQLELYDPNCYDTILKILGVER